MAYTHPYLRRYQTTLAHPVVITGIGVHSGKEVSVKISPCDASSGFIFHRSDTKNAPFITAHVDDVSMTTLCTVIGCYGSGEDIATIEHVMAALAGLSVDNALIEVDGSEMPVMDGSSLVFVEAIKKAGLKRLDAPRRFIEVLKTVRFEDDDAWTKFDPYEGYVVDVSIDFSNPLIGQDRIICDVAKGEFEHKLSAARTFGFMEDVKRLRNAGFCQGSSLENSIAIDNGEIKTKVGLRFKDEFVRHKALDAVGDLTMAGAPLLGYFSSYKGGHRLNAEMLRTLFKNNDAWRYYEAEPVRGKMYRNIPLVAAATTA